MRKGIFLFFVLAACGLARAATVTGTVRDSFGAPMPFVTISMLAADSSLVGGTITTDDGLFSIDAARATRLRASYMGYRSVEVSLLSRGDSVLIIVLQEETTALSEVTVQGRQKLVERRMDKIVMNVASSPFALGNNGKDILKKAPGVNFDRQGKITVNGKAVEVYIDGQPTYLSGEQLKSLLEGTDGSTIDRLEIITQPSARYDAAGQGGIINIRTKRNMTRGINGSMSGSYGGMYWRDLQQYMQDDHLSFNFNYRGQKTFSAFTFTQQYSDRTESYRSKVTTPEEERESFSRLRSLHQYYHLKLSNDWYIDTLNTIGLTFSAPLSSKLSTGQPLYNYSTLSRNGQLAEQNTEEQRDKAMWLQHNAGIHYMHKFSNRLEQVLMLNFGYNRNRSQTFNRTTSVYNGFIPWEQAVETDNYHTTDIYSAKVDFESVFWRTGKVECGSKWLTTRTGYEALTDTLSSDANAEKTAFRYTEHILALYITAGKQFGEQWTTKVGLRGEYTRSVGKWLAIDSTSVRSYFHLFPTVYIGYMPTENWSISADYTRRIQRPGYVMLNPSVQVEDAHSIRIGNTQLQPAFTHNLLLSIGYSEYVSLDYEFSHTTDLIDYRTIVLPGGDRVAQAVNYGTNTSHGIHLSLTEVPIVPRFSSRSADGRRQLISAWLALTAQIGAMHEHYRSNDLLSDMRQWSADVYAELNAYLPHEWTISVDGYYSTPSIWGTERLSAWRELNLAIRKDFPKQGVTLSARVNDLSLSSQWDSENLSLSEGYTSFFTGNDRAHLLTLGITWKFGTTLEHRRMNTTETDTDRIDSTGGRRRR